VASASERRALQVLAIMSVSTEVLRKCIPLLFEKAVAEPKFCALYADLSAILSRELAAHDYGSDDGKPISFKRELLNTCQVRFWPPCLLRHALKQLMHAASVAVAAPSSAAHHPEVQRTAKRSGASLNSAPMHALQQPRPGSAGSARGRHKRPFEVHPGILRAGCNFHACVELSEGPAALQGLQQRHRGMQDEFEGMEEQREKLRLEPSDSEADADYARRKLKMRQLGTMRLLAELFNRDLLTPAIMKIVTTELLSRGKSAGGYDSDLIECLVQVWPSYYSALSRDARLALLRSTAALITSSPPRRAA
jgi:hypothetical protein